MYVHPISIPLPFSQGPKFHRVIPPSSQPKITSLYNIWPRNWFSRYVSFRRNYFMSSFVRVSCSRFPSFRPIPVIISIFHRWIHNSTLYPSGWDGNWMKLELKYNRIQKKEGNNKRRKIYIYNFSPRREKKITNWSMLWKVERKSVDFPPFPPFQWRMGEKRERGNERERNSIAGGWKIVVHENIARLTVNDLAWNSKWWMTLTDVPRPAKRRIGRKGISKGGSAPIFPFFDMKIGRPSPSPSRVEGNITYCTNSTWLAEHIRVIRRTRACVSRARNGGFITRREGRGGIEKSRRSLDSIPPDLTRIPCSTLFNRCGSTRMDNVKDEYIETRRSFKQICNASEIFWKIKHIGLLSVHFIRVSMCLWILSR